MDKPVAAAPTVASLTDSKWLLLTIGLLAKKDTRGGARAMFVG